MLWMVGYLVAGIVAIIATAIYVVVVIPYTCGYEFEDWTDFFLEYFEVDQSKLENCIGIVLTMILWPIKIVWMLCDVIPTSVNTYDAQFEED